ncbi:MAG: monooxygenase [Pseudonocardiales bacterium]|nr:MAG: monooxygenase [Pseudonocardiales bacterium]
MTVTRQNILMSAAARDRFLDGVVALAQEDAGMTTSDVNGFLADSVPGYRIHGKVQPLTTWDLFVLWHHLTMSLPTTPSRPLRNLAHGGPVFCPWHRMFLLRMEEQLQRVTGDASTALPYWDWAIDGGRHPADQPSAPLWQADALGGSSGDVVSGRLAGLQVRLEGYGSQLWSVDPRPLRRNATTDIATLPTAGDVRWALGEGADVDFDRSQWDAASDAFRNRLEGWLDPAPVGGRLSPQLHNRVHVWVGGDMSPGSSPNDPVFYLNHCNVDRIWEAWMGWHGRSYRPVAGDPAAPDGHKLDDPLVALLGASLKPSDVLDSTAKYRYDDLNVG